MSFGKCRKYISLDMHEAPCFQIFFWAQEVIYQRVAGIRWSCSLKNSRDKKNHNQENQKGKGDGFIPFFSWDLISG
jgi:hypothetical protein